MVKLFKCSHCGNIVEIVIDRGVPVVCCGEPMQLLEANTTDAATEKHVPVVSVSGNNVTVTVGSVPHPMVEEHLIQFIILETDKGIYKKYLKASEEPTVEFVLPEGEKAVAAYEYCNLHGFWKAML